MQKSAQIECLKRLPDLMICTLFNVQCTKYSVIYTISLKFRSYFVADITNYPHLNYTHYTARKDIGHSMVILNNSKFIIFPTKGRIGVEKSKQCVTTTVTVVHTSSSYCYLVISLLKHTE